MRNTLCLMAWALVGVVALWMRRRFVGVELKESYYRQAVANLRDAEDAGCAAELPLLAQQEPTDA